MSTVQDLRTGKRQLNDRNDLSTYLYCRFMGGPSTYTQTTLAAIELLGGRVRLARKERRWTVVELAERVGVSPVTIRKVEHGDPTVALGTAFEAAVLTGVTLFDDDPGRRSLEADQVRHQLAVLPASIRRTPVDDDF